MSTQSPPKSKLLRSSFSPNPRTILMPTNLYLPPNPNPNPNIIANPAHLPHRKCLPDIEPPPRSPTRQGALALRLPIASYLCGEYTLYGYLPFHDAGLVNAPLNPS
ncbi:hypothetical protein JAAARDRAFT_39591 [Jaapia argillacea MUCL 33604]|uniref:Uncharacterized protein n=1 Tax=Jaapia argillacea MUCL 33604 TaxID=933084 RepID=A0A067PSB3_9AGAM|nr:hypothetical protein JAAARDRAFT_39591 [Jaapia argillacea MUCL 33604]